MIYCKPVAATAINHMRDGSAKDHVIATGLYNHSCIALPMSFRKPAGLNPAWGAPPAIYWRLYAPHAL